MSRSQSQENRAGPTSRAGLRNPNRRVGCWNDYKETLVSVSDPRAAARLFSNSRLISDHVRRFAGDQPRRGRRARRRNDASPLWCLENNCDNNVVARIPRPIASITDAGGEYPPLRCCRTKFQRPSARHACGKAPIRQATAYSVYGRTCGGWKPSAISPLGMPASSKRSTIRNLVFSA